MATLRTIADHIMDISENAVKSGGDKGYLIIIETEEHFRFTISDNGRGMDQKTLKKALDPFYTTKEQRKKKIGLGLAFLKQSLEQTDGTFIINSKKGIGTTVIADFNLRNIDCQPIGSIPEILIHILTMDQEFNWEIYRYYEKKGYYLNSQMINDNFDLTKPQEIMTLKKYIIELEKEIKGGI